MKRVTFTCRVEAYVDVPDASPIRAEDEFRYESDFIAATETDLGEMQILSEPTDIEIRKVEDRS